MKKALLLTCLLGLVTVGLAFSAESGKFVTFGNNASGVTILNEDPNGVTLQVSVQNVEFIPVQTKGGAFVLPRVDNFTHSKKIGEPSLPIVNRLLTIPFDADLRVEVLATETEQISIKALGFTDQLMPVQPSLSKSEDPADVPFEFDAAAYAIPGNYELPAAQTEIEGTMRGIHLGMVSISPFTYNPAEGTMEVAREMTIRVEFLGGDWVRTEDNWKKNYSPFFEPIYQQIQNYEGFTSLFGSKEDSIDLVKYPVKYMIISDRMFEDYLEPFIEWKTQKGFTVITAYTDEIGFSSTDIKDYIDSAYQAGTISDPAPSFVLFVGDAQEIPPFSGSAGSHITDLKFCEFTGDNLPEIYYGRFSASDTADLRPQIEKTLEYEKYLMPDPSYLEHVTMVSGYDSYGHDVTHGNGQINYGSTYYFNAAHGIDPYIWLSPASSSGTAPADIIQTIRDGTGFYNYTAHCSHDGHGTPSFVSSDVSGLNNEHKYLLAIGNCCQANTFGTGYSTPCFGEVFLRAENEGGIGYIGGTNSTYWDEDYYWGVGYGPIIGAGPTYEETGQGAYDGVFHDHGEPVTKHFVTNSAIIFAGNLAVSQGGSRDDYYWEIYTLMGDPSVMTYLGIPTANTVTYSPTIMMTASSFEVQADPASYVGISFDGVLHGQGYVDETGMLDVPLTAFGAPGEAIVVITGQNKIPVIDTVDVITPDGPFVVYDYCDINDLTGGNGNNLIDYGETVYLGMQLENVGPDTAFNVDATLSTADTFVTLTDDFESYATIPGEYGTTYIADAFGFKVSPNTPDQHRIHFQLNIHGTDKWDTTWVSNFNLTTHAPEVGYVSVVVNDASGNNNGILDPGETAELVVTVVNDGSGQASDIVANLSETDPNVTVDDDYGYIGFVDSTGGTGDNSGDAFVVTASSSTVMGYELTFDLTITGAGNYFRVLHFDFVVGDREALYTDDFSSDQGWTGLAASAEWTIGPATGGAGSDTHGGPDPAEDHSPSTDNQVLGNDLTSGTGGDYNSSIGSTQWATSPVINCEDYSSLQLTFYRWLGIEKNNYDEAHLEVYDGTSWVSLFENGSSDIDDQAWIEEFYDISAYADDNPNFQIRFGLGKTDGSYNFCGWNIDDITIKGYNQATGTPAMAISGTEIMDSLDIDLEVPHNVHIKNNGDGRLKVNFSSEQEWLDFSTAQNYVYPGDSIDFPITINTNELTGGDYVGSVAYSTNDPAHPSGTIPVNLHVYAPVCGFTVTEVIDSLDPGDTAEHLIPVTNDGLGTLKLQFSSEQAWLEFDTGEQTVAPEGAIDFAVTIDAADLVPGDYAGTITYTTNDPENADGYIAVNLNIYMPVIGVSHAAIDMTIPIAQSDSMPVVITNTGPGMLNFQVGCIMYSKTVAKTAAAENPQPLGYRVMDIDKGGAMEPYFAPQTKGAGGPDSYGHSWIDSDDPSGPAYVWIDISSIGTSIMEIDSLGDDDTSRPIPIGFDFPFYENAYSEITAGSNGVLSFGGGIRSRSNTELPLVDDKNNLIALFWDDLDIRKGGDIYYHYDDVNERFIVSYVNVPLYSGITGTGSVSCQAILYPNGSITMQYATMDPGTDSLSEATVGIENADGTDALQIAYNAAYMHSNLAINISAGGWLSIQPRGGTVAPMTEDTVMVTLDATELAMGMYSGRIMITSNDPITPVWDISVSLEVGAQYVCGDVDQDGEGLINLLDILYLIDFVYSEGPALPEPNAADVDNSGAFDLLDILALIDYLYGEGGAVLNCP